ncbi:hypothetical protein [Microvirga sp. KLBC 81]|uniref:hypothetical protein n=1 Tax=Microvirga sp. KLBC 81 TaxID=1862707 RepID=UPI0010578817|nr:hypothetical protein [Microvirga sp. KLBC 81]
MRASFKTLMAAVLFFGGAAAAELSTASAQSIPRPVLTGRTGVYGMEYRGARYYPRGSFSPRSYGGYRRTAYYGPRYGYRRAAYYSPRYYGYRRAAYYGPRYRYYSRYPYYPYRRYYRDRYYDGGGAVVAGLIGGLTLGTLASPYYYGYGPAYYPSYYAPTCVIERRRVVNRYGRYVWRRVQVCY